MSMIITNHVHSLHHLTTIGICEEDRATLQRCLESGYHFHWSEIYFDFIKKIVSVTVYSTFTLSYFQIDKDVC